MSHPPGAYPLIFEPVVMEKVWGGRRLGSLGKVLSKPDAKYGESWELADLDSTSASGAGGQGVRSVIANGPMRGRTIREAIAAWGDDLMSSPAGDRRATPLLIKYLDACEDLSVQVHPSPEYAAAHPDAHLKTECWYIMDADPSGGAKIYKGIKPGVSRDEFSRLARAGDPRIVDTLLAWPAIPGECHNLPSGTVHALGAGVLVAEVQTPSDTTYRLYDWGRAGREMHIEQALACADFTPPPPAIDFSQASGILASPFYTISMARWAAGPAAPLAAHAGCVLMFLRGQGEIVCDDPNAGQVPIPVKRGSTVLVPRRTGTPWSIRPVGTERVEALRAGLPERR